MVIPNICGAMTAMTAISTSVSTSHVDVRGALSQAATEFLSCMDPSKGRTVMEQPPRGVSHQCLQEGTLGLVAGELFKRPEDLEALNLTGFPKALCLLEPCP